MIDWTKITEFDLIVLIVIGLSGLLALHRGFLASALALGGWVISITLAHYLFPYIEPFLRKKTGSDFLVVAIGYIGGLIGFLIIMGIVNFIVLTALHGLRHSLIDKFLGLLFGAARGIVLICFFFLCFLAIASGISGKNIEDQDLVPSFIQTSQSYAVLQRSQKYFLTILPDSLTKNLQNKDNKESNSNDILIIAAIKKLAEYTEPSVLQRIQDETKQYSSDRQVALSTLQKLYMNYHQQHGQDDEAPIDSSELTDIQKLLNKK